MTTSTSLITTKTRYLAIAAALSLYVGTNSTSAAQQAVAEDHGVVSLALTFDSTAANITTSNRFWLYGGSAELNASLFHGFGLTAAVTGLHTADSGGGVPINIVMETFGPSYTRQLGHTSHPVTLSAHGLIGEANGFNGLYPRPIAPESSASSLAARVGGGLDLRVSHHLSIRLVEANWLRTQLPNSTTNVQNNLELGAGIVLRTTKH